MTVSSKDTGVARATWWQAALLIRGQTEVDQRNIRNFTLWTFCTTVGFVAVAAFLATDPALRGPAAWTLALVPVVLGMLAVRSFLRFLREADEFMRKIQLEGIAIGFCAGLLYCFASVILEQGGLPRLPVSSALFPLTLGWAFGSFFVASRYR